MEPYLTITTLNDFVFCPKSIYFHHLYGKYHHQVYKQKPQIVGTINHENIDKQKYSSAKRYIQGLAVFSEKYKLCGKIDVYDSEKKVLIERKTKIKKIYDGYKYQLLAQYFCMQEMGFEIKKLKFHSLTDNKNYFLNIPKQNDLEVFENILFQIRNFNIENKNFVQNPEKCRNCIYAGLCDSDASLKGVDIYIKKEVPPHNIKKLITTKNAIVT